VNYYQKSPTLVGTGKIATKLREQEASLRRQRVNGYGVTTGPLGTWVAYTPRKKSEGTGSSAYYA
jgi:hypothetical protein